MIRIEKDGHGVTWIILECDRCGATAKPMPNESLQGHLYAAKAGFVLRLDHHNVHKHYCRFCADAEWYGDGKDSTGEASDSRRPQSPECRLPRTGSENAALHQPAAQVAASRESNNMAAAKKKPKSGSNGHKTERIVRTLRCDLTIDEVSDRADRAAHLLAKRDEKDADRKAAQTHMGGEIKELEAELRRVSTEVRDRAAFRPVECEVQFDYQSGRVITIRLDTGAQIDERPMEPHERQRALPIPDPESEPQPVH